MQEGEKFSEDRDHCSVSKLTDIKRGITTLCLSHVINANYIVEELFITQRNLNEFWTSANYFLFNWEWSVSKLRLSNSLETSLTFSMKYRVVGFFITKNKYICGFPYLSI